MYACFCMVFLIVGLLNFEVYNVIFVYLETEYLIYRSDIDYVYREN